MKTRSDFVSNSSSTSFVVAVNPGYDIYAFSKDLAEKTVSKGDEHHDPKLQKLNELNLSYCLTHFELLFLGSFLVKTSETVIRKDELPKTFESGYVFDQLHWKEEMNLLERWQKIKNNPKDPDYGWMRDHDLSWFDDKTQTLHMVDKHYVCGLGIDVDSNYRLSRHKWFEDLVESGKATKQQLEIHKENITARMEMLKELCEKYDRDYESVYTSDSYQITLDTIKTTKEMLQNGFEMEFDDWENITEIEERLKKGELIFRVRANNSGDGYLKDGVFCEDGSQMLTADDGMAMEYLHSECG